MENSMFDSRNQKRLCGLAENTSAYVYKELSADELEDFENHLVTCSTCPEEISQFALIVGEIDRWKTTQFDAIQTPEIVYQPDQRSVVTVLTDEQTGLFDRIRAFFGSSSLLWQTGAACAAVILTLTFVWIYLPSGSPDTLAENPLVGDESILEESSPVESKDPAVSDLAGNFPEASKDAALEVSPKPPVNIPAKPVKTKRKITKRRTKVKNTRQKVRSPKKSAPPKEVEPAIQRLTEFAIGVENGEDDDDLRLAELFADADAEKDKK